MQDNPLQAVADDKMIPILGLDVWEHGGSFVMISNPLFASCAAVFSSSVLYHTLTLSYHTGAAAEFSMHQVTLFV